MDGKKVLLIEDEDFIRDLYKRQLDQAKMPTDAFANGTDGLKALKSGSYDLVLLDIMLPDMNGLQILKTIKSDSQTQHIPVIMLTNLGQEQIIKEGFALGAESYLIKASYTPDQMVEEVRNFLLSNHK